jgi:hypothetical protein
MRRHIFLCSMILMIAGCRSNLDTNTSILLQPAKNKRSLMKMGFKQPDINALIPEAVPLPADPMKEIRGSAGQKWSNSLLTKRKQDTDALFTFREDELIGVQILIDHANLARLYSLLDSLGFEKVGSPNGPSQVFVNRQANIRYEMSFLGGQAIFTDDIAKQIGTGKPQGMVQPMDTVRGAADKPPNSSALISHVRKAINPKYQHWVLFSNGTYVIIEDSTVQDAAGFATKIIKQYGPVYPGSPAGDFGVIHLTRTNGWAVSGQYDAMYTYVDTSELLNAGIQHPADVDVGLLGRRKRDKDGKECRIIYISK